MAASDITNRSFEAIEQLEELPRELGWPLQYRQLEPGPLSSTFTEVEDASWFLMEEQSSRRLEVQAAAPAGMYLLGVVEGYPATVNGQALTPNHVLFHGPDSDMRVTLPAGIKIRQIGILAEQYSSLLG